MTARLPSVPYPRLDRLFRTGETVWERRADVRAACKDVASWQYWCWMMFPGAVEHGEIQAAIYPLPGGHLTQRVVGGTPLVEYVRNGVVDAMRVHRCLAEAGFDFTRPGRMLDFGCGCGRLLTVMARHADVIDLCGTDVDEDAISFCRETYDFATFQTLPVAPPSSYPDQSFDAIYGYSVFTHLDAPGTAAWVAELARIARPGALVVLTTGGRRLVEHFLSPDGPDKAPTPEALRARLPELEREGFLFFPYRKLEAADPRSQALFDSWDLERYGMTFLLEAYVRQNWLEDFELVVFHDAPDDWQDFVVLRRR
jgi:SAM-dependent methyltransferase